MVRTERQFPYLEGTLKNLFSLFEFLVLLENPSQVQETFGDRQRVGVVDLKPEFHRTIRELAGLWCQRPAVGDERRDQQVGRIGSGARFGPVRRLDRLQQFGGRSFGLRPAAEVDEFVDFLGGQWRLADRSGRIDRRARCACTNGQCDAETIRPHPENRRKALRSCTGLNTGHDVL